MSVRKMTLPRLVAGRDYAWEMVATVLGADFVDDDVVVDASGLLTGTSSFAAALVEAILVHGKAASLTLAASPAGFADDATAAARALQVTDRFDLSEAVPEAHAV